MTGDRETETHETNEPEIKVSAQHFHAQDTQTFFTKHGETETVRDKDMERLRHGETETWRERDHGRERGWG